MRDKHTLNSLYELKESAEDASHGVQIRIDPTLNIAVDLAIGEGLLERGKNSQLSLTTLGLSVLADLETEKLLSSEASAIGMLGKFVTEEKARELLKGAFQ
jgi:hypothetical protein